MNEPREYKNSVFYTLLVIIIVGISIFALLFVIGVEQTGFIMLPLAVVFTIFSIAFLYMAASATAVSEDEISSKTLFGVKTLKWSEIARVSGRGQTIKLHNFDSDVTITLRPRQPGYEEIIERIGAKRPDLFDPKECSKASKGWMGLINLLAASLLGLGFSALGVFAYIISDSKDTKDIMISVACVLMGLFFTGMYLFVPWSVAIQEKSITVGYLFKRKRLTIEDISSISLGVAQTRRGGRNYYVFIGKRDGVGIQISGLKPSVPIVYLVLKNWYKQNA